MTRPLHARSSRFWLCAGALALALAAPAARAEAGGKYALLVGVQKYEKVGLRNLDFPENDVTVLASVLKDHGYRVVLMTHTRGSFDAQYQPSSAKIRGELKKMLKGRTADDTVLVAFCGHGVQFTKRDEPYFCPMDTNVANRRTLVSLSEVYDELKASSAGAKLLIADACRNDPLPKGTKESDADAKLLSPTMAGHHPPANVLALFSCKTGETALESPDLKHGVFFYHLIRALRGKGLASGTRDVTLLALTDYLQRQVPRYVQEQFDEQQHPEIFGRSDRPIVLLTLGPARKKPTKPATNAWDLVEKGMGQMQEQNYQQGVSKLTEALKLKPNALVYAKRADAYEGLGDLDRALADANQAVALDPKSEVVYQTRGSIYHARRDYDQAIADYTRAIQLSPKYTVALKNRGLAYDARGETRKALADYSEALRLHPRDFEALNNRGSAYAHAKKIEQAIADYSRAVRFSPRFAEAYHNRGLARIRTRDLDRAISDFSAALRYLPAGGRRGIPQQRAETYNNRGVAYFNKKNYPRAIEDFTQAITLAPKTARYYRYRALAHQLNGDKAQAERDREKAKQLSGNSGRGIRRPRKPS
jgi:tetratricopeptide (TPR) repeat protein